MKKTFSINISGQIFHIDDDAYEMLQRYLANIKSHFRGFEGKDEVISDIEARIAEILQSKITGNKQVVDIEDIREVIKTMGQPTDFDLDEEEQDTGQTTPPITRTVKRLYRDPEGKMIGGVCSGIAAYFNIDPLWVRLLFLFFTFVPGFGLPLYLILWIVVPEATTAAEKLEMRGQPVTVSNLERSLREELDHLKEKLNDLTGKARDTYKKKRAEAADLKDPLRDGLSSIFHFIGRVLLIFIGIVLLLVGLSLAVAFIASAFGFPGIIFFDQVTVDVLPLSSYVGAIFQNDSALRVFWISSLVVLGIPLLLLLIYAIRLIFNLKKSRTVTGMLAYSWLLAFILTIIFGLTTLNSFTKHGEAVIETSYPVMQGDTVNFMLRDGGKKPVYQKDFEALELGHMRIGLRDGERYLYGLPYYNFRYGKDGEILVKTNIIARGRSTADAVENAEIVHFRVESSGRIVTLPSYFELPENSKWRAQEVETDIYLPAGTYVILDKSFLKLKHYYLKYRKEISEGKVLIMTDHGLEDPDRLPVTPVQNDSTLSSKGISPIMIILMAF